MDDMKFEKSYGLDLTDDVASCGCSKIRVNDV